MIYLIDFRQHFTNLTSSLVFVAHVAPLGRGAREECNFHGLSEEGALPSAHAHGEQCKLSEECRLDSNYLLLYCQSISSPHRPPLAAGLGR